MDTPLLQQQARRELESRLEDMREARDSDDGFDGVYGVQVEPVITLTLAGGGPSAWIEYRPQSNEATFFTTAPGYAESAPRQSVPLSAAQVADLESYAELAREQYGE